MKNLAQIILATSIATLGVAGISTAQTTSPSNGTDTSTGTVPPDSTTGTVPSSDTTGTAPAPDASAPDAQTGTQEAVPSPVGTSAPIDAQVTPVSTRTPTPTPSASPSPSPTGSPATAPF